MKELKMLSPTLDRLQTAFNIIALASLKENGEEVYQDNIDYEAARIERCVEHFYVKEDHDLQYPEYASKFLSERYNDIVYSEVYLGDWLDDVQHVSDGSSVNEFSILV
jgi:uncharacterized radical SAM superfamily Fe-S cluster-containing enzyme